MITIKTVSEKEFRILWDGVAFDGILRFAVINGDMNKIFTIFNDAEETKTLTRDIDGVKTVYSDFTVFNGINKDKMGNIIVSLAKGGIT